MFSFVPLDILSFCEQDNSDVNQAWLTWAIEQWVSIWSDMDLDFQITFSFLPRDAMRAQLLVLTIVE